MSILENELKELREQNNELVQKVQYWKVAAAQKDNEKLKVMKEANELRLRLSTLRNKGASNAQKLYAALQTASEEALSHLVQASNNMARILELMKGYMQDRENMEYSSQWNLSSTSTPTTDKVHRVPPLMLGGRSIQPVVSLSRTVFSNNSGDWISSRSSSRSQNSSTVRAMPMHMLQDVYIPLTRIDAGDATPNDVDMENNADNNSTEELGLDDSNERLHVEETNSNSNNDDSDEFRRLDAVTEEPEENDTPIRNSIDNPMEGPSWLLDGGTDKVNVRRGKNLMSLEPNIVECEEMQALPRSGADVDACLSAAFTPTVRRKRSASPRPPPPTTPRTPHTPMSPVFSPRPKRNNNRILKVLVSKMRLDDDDASPPKRPMTAQSPKRSHSREASNSREVSNSREASNTRESSPDNVSRELPVGRPRELQGTREEAMDRGRAHTSPELVTRINRCPSFDAPSPNGSTDARVIVFETASPNRVARRAARSRTRSGSGSDSDVTDEPRTRRARNHVVYKEKPLNRKLRR